MKERFGDCCNRLLTGDRGVDNPDFSHAQVLSRGGLTIPSTNLLDYISTALTIPEFVDNLITKSGLPVRKAGEGVLSHCFQSFETFTSRKHEVIARKVIKVPLQ